VEYTIRRDRDGTKLSAVQVRLQAAPGGKAGPTDELCSAAQPLRLQQACVTHDNCRFVAVLSVTPPRLLPLPACSPAVFYSLVPNLQIRRAPPGAVVFEALSEELLRGVVLERPQLGKQVGEGARGACMRSCLVSLLVCSGSGS